MKVKTFKIYNEMEVKIRNYARKKGITESEVIRRALEKFIDEVIEPKERVFETERIKVYG